jgi:transcriptional regulator with XRE-family HTH domain
MPGSIIRHFRELRNYSQQWVASQLGMSQNAYSKIENHLTQLTVHHVRELSRILEVPELDLLRDDFEIHKPVLLPKVVHKEDLIQHLDNLRRCLEDRSTLTHDHYPLVMSYILAAEETVNGVR